MSEIAAGQRPAQAYAGRQKIYPKLAHGKFRKIKWAVMVVTLGIYYLLPWIRWDRGPNLPDQAFLLDFANQRLFFGPIEIWAQELYYITGLLILSALGLFLVTAVAGRMWCGYTCPQTVWTDLMIVVERFWQGDRNARIRLDNGPWTFEKVWKKTGTHISWLLIAVATGGALVFYFRDAPTLANELINGDAPAVAYVFLAVFTGTTYLLGGIAREQVCIYMCPWPRIQAAMFDRDSLLVSYRDWRGEPRGAHKKGQSWEGRGDCVDCTACVTVCPMGIDIRNGSQLECIQCALCIDACDEIMERVGRPKGLIAYDTFRNLDAPSHDKRVPVRLIRPRTLIYSTLMLAVGGLMLTAWLHRADLDVNILHDRNPMFVQLSDGSLRNGFTLKILNKQHEVRHFRLALADLDGASMSVVGFEGKEPVIEVVPDDLRALKVLVTVPAAMRDRLDGNATEFRFAIIDAGDGSVTYHDATFRGPENER
ncbi:cytochrome c oxidase accessory protein CcoG [Hyphomicrobium sp.]|uniref:cytochrome c oxidase accessory protein CcoG n=1 Tax=Hyphomicrobium sp. TaxID=82 RepID=UPI0025B91D05|nr:cytochrome c oxidase accessory protein CcoG [Hyphomicrobium sp.]